MNPHPNTRLQSDPPLAVACGKYVGLLEQAVIAVKALHHVGVYGERATRAAAAAVADNATDYNRAHFSGDLNPRDLQTLRERVEVIARLRAIAATETMQVAA